MDAYEEFMTDVSTTRTTKHNQFYIATVTFLVEDCLFRVPRQPFETDSSVFKDMFSVPAGEGMPEGMSDENPIRLEDTKIEDFEQLLKLLLYRLHGQAQELPEGIEQWTSVLRLSTRWDFGGLRQKAIEALEAIPICPIDKVVLANSYGITDWWLPAMNELAQRPEPISMEDAEQLGFETALKLASVREHLALRPVQRSLSCNYNHTKHSYSTNELIVGPRESAVQKLDFIPVLRTIFNLADSPEPDVGA